ncbi:MAG: thioredoxin family protein [Phycisphaerales bacterium]
MKTKPSSLTILIVLLLVALMVPRVIGLIRGPAPTPDVFSDGYTMDQAAQISSDTGKPMLVLVTADWCAPCQTLKRNTLTDPAVAGWISSSTVPVYLEDGQNREEIQRLGVAAYPTTLLMQGGRVITAIEGARNPAGFMQALATSAPAPAAANP